MPEDTLTCPYCVSPLNDGQDLHTDEDGITAHADCHDMERSANFGDYISREYDLK